MNPFKKTMQQIHQPRIFISYKRADKERVFAIKDSIEQATGERCWIDLDGIESDAQFVEVIMNAIDDCEVFLFMRSAEHNKITNHRTDWTIREVNYALGESKRIVFVALDNSPLPRWFKFMFPNQQEIDATDAVRLRGLCKDLQVWLSAKTKDKVLEKVQDMTSLMTSDVLTIKHGRCQFDMIRVEGGNLLIGATDEQVNAESNEYPAHEVTISTFYIGKYPITQDVWESVMGYNKSRFKQDIDGTELLPVESITYDEAQEFVRRLSKMTNIKFSLPTEEEWEYAARGGQKTMQYQYAGGDDINDVAWYKGNSNDHTHPVGLKKPNELGLYDMCGNVWEWTDTPAHAYGVEIEAKGNVYIRRGGSWWHGASNCRIARRYASDHTKKTGGLGLRVVIRENVQ